MIEIKDLTKTYGVDVGKTVALNKINLKIYDGELLCILGESGSGKSTLLNLISCIDKPTSGSIKFNGVELTNKSDNELTDFRSKEVGFVFQFFNLIDELDVYRNMTVIPSSYQDKNKVQELLKLVNLENKIDKFPRELSGGEQQRISIARALNKPSSLLLCDEPTGALDYKTGKSILALIEKIHKSTDKTVIIVTHTKEIAQMCDRVVTLKSGEILDIKENKTIKKASEIDW